MPTQRGWLLCLSSLTAAAGGRILGLKELYVLSAAGAALLVAAVAYVSGRRFALDGRRRLFPARLPAGGRVRVELRVVNRGRWPTPVLGLEDGPEGSFLLTALRAGEEATAAYGTAAIRRGLVPVGPLRVRLTDPFGVASRAVTLSAPSILTVHPSYEIVPPLPPAPAGALPAGPRRPFATPLTGEDFHALRPYEEGEDLRLVHWPSSARRDVLLVRQDEAPRVQSTTVVLDLRSSVHHGPSLEAAVSAAAGVAAAAVADDGVVRLVTTGGADSGAAGGEAHFEALLDRLAVVEADHSGHLGAAAAALGDSAGATLVLVTTTAVPAADLDPLAGLRRMSPMVVAVVVEVAGHPATPPLPVDSIVRLAADGQLGVVWGRAFAMADR